MAAAGGTQVLQLLLGTPDRHWQERRVQRAAGEWKDARHLIVPEARNLGHILCVLTRPRLEKAEELAAIRLLSAACFDDVAQAAGVLAHAVVAPAHVAPPGRVIPALLGETLDAGLVA